MCTVANVFKTKTILCLSLVLMLELTRINILSATRTLHKQMISAAKRSHLKVLADDGLESSENLDVDAEVFGKFGDSSDEERAEGGFITPHNWGALADTDLSYQDSKDVLGGGSADISSGGRRIGGGIFMTRDKAQVPSTLNSAEILTIMGNNNNNNDTNKIKSDSGGGAGTGTGTLDEFVTGKLGNTETGVTLPYFLTEPESAYVVKNRPAVLKCKATHALQLHFKCSGSSQPPPSTHDKHVDPHTGVHLEEVTATIHRDLVDEYFGKGPFKCECHAWSSRGVVKSQAATVNIAYIRKQFVTSPTSLRIELGSRAELYCEAPNGYPDPMISWYKNNVPLASSNEHGPTITATGTLTFRQATLQDMANYTCVAENIAGKRNSDSAVLIVYVNGGWSSWSSWRDCKCQGKQSQGRKRTRTCTNPMPMNGGSECNGPQIQKSADCLTCPDETQIVSSEGFDMPSPPTKRTGRWSVWSEWSSCSSDCIQMRRRKCISSAAAAAAASILDNNNNHNNDDDDDDDDDGDDVADAVRDDGGLIGSSSISGSGVSSALIVGGSMTMNSGGGGGVGSVVGNGKFQCSGKDIQTAECRGEHCQIGKDDFDWTLYLGLAFITAVFFAFGSALICCARRGIRVNQHYGMTRTVVVDPKYLPDINKKDIRMHIETSNDNYDYANPGQRFLPPPHHMGSSSAGGGGSGGVGIGCMETEHHYDVPNLSANYVNPIDDLSVDYLSDTPDTSTVDTSNSTYVANGKLSCHPTSKSSTYDQLNCNGGSLALYSNEIVLYIPEHSIGRTMRKHVSLMLLSDEMSRINIPNHEGTLVVASTTVHCSPRNYSFLKPVILKIPHCLLDPNLWIVSIYHADAEYDDVNVNWRKILVVGEETINTPVFVQLEPHHVYLMTEQLGRFVVVGEPRMIPSISAGYSSLKMRLLAFSQFTASGTNYSLRIYIVREFPNSRDLCTSIETKLGGSFMGESDTFAFHLNNNSMNIRLCSAEVELWESECDVTAHQQIIPYQHILSNNSVLHCEFIIKRNELLYTEFNLRIDFAQCGSTRSCSNGVNQDSEVHSFRIRRKTNSLPPTPPHTSLERQATVSMDNHGNYVNETSLPLTWMHLPIDTKRRICSALDPPREDEHDWRLLAKKLNTDRYIAYFATKPSPTEQILNLWECRASQRSSSPAHTIVELLMILKDMERQDVMDIITETIGSLWI